MRLPLRTILSFTLLGALAACGSSGTSGSEAADTGGTSDAGVDAPADVRSIDAPDTARPDTPTNDAPPLGAGLGEPCEENAECASNMCLDVVAGDGGGICSTPCVSDAGCPRDFDCVLVADTGADAQRVCLPVDLCIDPDGDRHGVGPGCIARDCDEGNVAVNLSADEVCDGVDNDCDGQVDDNPIDVGDDCETGFAGVCGAGRTACASGLITCSART